MDFFRPLGRAGLAWRSLGLAAGHFSIWMPLFVVAMARIAAALVLSSFHSPWLAPFAVPLVNWLGGEPATHYPEHFRVLPTMFAQLEIFISVLIASIALGASVVGFAVCFSRREFAPAWVLALRAAPQLMLLALLAVGVTIASAAIFERLLPIALPARLLGPGVWAAQLGVNVLLQTLLAYSIAAIMLQKRNLLAAITFSASLALKNPLTTLLLVGVPILLLQVSALSLSRWNPITRGLAPEWISLGLLLQIVLELLLAFAVLGSTTRIFLSRAKLAS